MFTKIIKMSVLAMVAFLTVACNGNRKTAERTTLLEANPAAEHPEWQVSNDTIKKEFLITIGKKEVFEIPVQLSWLNAVDTTGSHSYVAFYKLERMGGSSKVVISDVKASIAEGGDLPTVAQILQEEEYVYETKQRISILGNIKAPFFEGYSYQFVFFTSQGECLNPNNNYQPY